MNQKHQPHALFDVRFESVGYTSEDRETEFTEEEARGFSDTAAEEGTLPDGVVAVVRGNISEDDAQDPDDRKVFVSVTLRVSAESEDAADNFAAPVDLLTKIADLMSTSDGGVALHLEGDWEVADVEAAE